MSKKKRKEIGSPEVAIWSPMVVENLPYPHVHYPHFYGVLFSFSELNNSQQYFCSCSKVIIESVIKREKFHNEIGEIRTNWQLDCLFSDYYKTLLKQNTPYDTIFKYLPNLCHKCNLVKPTLRWCHEMYGNKFVQSYGWYIEQTKYRLGVFPHSHNFSDADPKIIELVRSLTYKRTIEISFSIDEEDGEKNYNLTEVESIERAIKKYAETLTREEFGIPRIQNFRGFQSPPFLL